MINRIIQNLKSKISNLKSHSGFMKYFKNTSWLFGERILRMVVALSVGVYVARYLGPQQYGLLSYATAFVGLFSAISYLGLNDIVIRELVKTPEKKDEVLGTAFLLKILGAIMMGSIIFIVAQFGGNDHFTNLLIAIIAIGFLFQGTQVIDFYFQATVQSKYVVQAQISQMVLSSIAKLILIWLSAPVLWFAIVSLSDSVILAAGLVWNYLGKVGRITYWKLKIKVASSLLKDSWPLAFTGLTMAVYMQMDKVMIKEMLNIKEVGYYTVASNLSQAWYFVPMAITGSLFPAIINAKKMNKELYHLRLQRLYDLMIWIALVISIPTSFLAPWIIKTLYGSAYQPAASVLSVYIWAGVFVFMGVVSGRWFIVENHTKVTLYIAICGAISNVILNLLLIPTIGIVGAAISTLVSQVIVSYICIAIYKPSRGNFIMATKSFNLLSSAKRILEGIR